MIEYSRFPVYVHLRGKQDAQDYDRDLLIQDLGYGMMFWDQSVEHQLLQECLQKLSNTARVTNIVCIAHGGLGRGAASILQHVAASSIAQEVIALYEQAGQPLENPITIIAQDPAYSTNDIDLLGHLPIPIRVVPDPEGFLAVNDTSLVMACYLTVPVKQMVADLAADLTSGRGLAAVLWNNSWWDGRHSVVDVVTSSWMDVFYFANAGSRRLLNMLQGYEKIMNGSEVFSHLHKAKLKQGDDEEEVDDGVVTDERLGQELKGLSLWGDADEGGPRDFNDGSEDSTDLGYGTEECETGHSDGKPLQGLPGFEWRCRFDESRATRTTGIHLHDWCK